MTGGGGAGSAGSGEKEGRGKGSDDFFDEDKAAFKEMISKPFADPEVRICLPGGHTRIFLLQRQLFALFDSLFGWFIFTMP